MNHQITAWVAAIAIGMSFAAPVAAQGPLPVEGFFPLGASAEFRWGVSVAVSGDLALVGTPHDDSLGLNAGLVRVLDISDPGAPVQIGTLSPSAPMESDFFGISVAIDGGVAVVGARAGLNGSAGAAYLFDLATGAELAVLPNPQGQPYDIFGSAVAIRGDRVLVGAPISYFEQPGYAMLYDISDAANPAIVTRLWRTDSGGEDSFGLSVAFAGDVAVVGAPGRQIFTDVVYSGDGVGRVRLYDARDGAEISEITIPDGALYADFGISIDTEGDLLVVGSPWESTFDTRAGAAYVYDVSQPEAPRLLRTVRDPHAVRYGQFGRSVRLGTGAAVVSAMQSAGSDGLPALAAFSPDLGVLTGRCDIPILGSEAAQDVLGVAVEGGLVVSGWWRSSQGAVHCAAAFHRAPAVCGPADLAGPFGSLDMFDVSAFLGLFNDRDDAADLAAPFGVWNFFDVSAFIALYNAGCP